MKTFAGTERFVGREKFVGTQRFVGILKGSRKKDYWVDIPCCRFQLARGDSCLYKANNSSACLLHITKWKFDMN